MQLQFGKFLTAWISCVNFSVGFNGKERIWMETATAWSGKFAQGNQTPSRRR